MAKVVKVKINNREVTIALPPEPPWVKAWKVIKEHYERIKRMYNTL